MEFLKIIAIVTPVVLSNMVVGCSPSKGQASSANQLANITVESTKVAFNAIKSIDGLDQQQQVCIESIDMQQLSSKIQTILEKDFSKKELDKLNEVYSSDAAKAYTNYGRDQIIISFGGTVKQPAPQPTEMQIKQITDFSNTELGQKYTTLNDSVTKGSMTFTVNQFVEDSLKKCHIDLTI